jgi:hypothetical protein
VSEILLTRAGRRYAADLSDPLSIAMPLDFDGVQPNHFGAPRAHAAPLAAGGFVGDVRAGGSVNCELLALAPHCNGTHTECVGHVTTDRVAVHEVLRGGLHIARLVSLRPAPLGDSDEHRDPDSAADEPVVTARALAAALALLPGDSEALIVRTTRRARWSRRACATWSSTCPRSTAPRTAAGWPRTASSGACRPARAARTTRAAPTRRSPSSPGSRRPCTTAGTCSTCSFPRS